MLPRSRLMPARQRTCVTDGGALSRPLPVPRPAGAFGIACAPGGLSAGQQALCLWLRAGGQLRRAFVCRRRRGVPAEVRRPLGDRDEWGVQLVVGADRRRGELPDSPIGVLVAVERGGERVVG